MKGILLEKEGNTGIVMTHSGEFVKAEGLKPHYVIGDEVIFKNRHTHIRKIMVAAAVLIFLFTGSLGIYGYSSSFGYVNVDINPSIEIGYNMFKRVNSIKGLNDDGEKLVNVIEDYKNKSVTEVLDMIIDLSIKENYIKREQKNVILVTVTNDRIKIDEEEIVKSVERHINENKVSAEIIEVKGDDELYKEAQQHNTSPGKLKLIKNLEKEEKGIDKYKDKNIKEIYEKINKKDNKTKEQKIKKESKDEEKRIKQEIKRTKKENKKENKEILKKSNNGNIKNKDVKKEIKDNKKVNNKKEKEEKIKNKEKQVKDKAKDKPKEAKKKKAHPIKKDKKNKK